MNREISIRTFIAILLLSLPTLTFAHNNPKGAADVMESNITLGGLVTHVGMWDNLATKVVEVSGDSPLKIALGIGKANIRKASLKSFKDRGYRGARYGKGTYSQRLRAIKWGYDQRYSDPNYTRTAKYRTGIWKRTIGKDTRVIVTRGQYRCDTFVYNSYRTAGVTDLSLKIITPHLLFSAFPKKR